MITSSSKHTLSIIIPTYNREKTLCNTIRDLLKFGDQYSELIIVDQTHKHLPETSSFLSNLPETIRLIKLPIPNLPKARNVGAKEAKGEILLYLDDDIEPTSTLLKAHMRHYEDPSIGGVAGRLVSPNGEIKKLDPRFYTSLFPWRYVRFDQDWSSREVNYAPGGNMSFRRSLILELGGFDEQFVGNALREETDFCISLRNASYRIIFDPEAAVVHYWKSEGGCDHIRLGNSQLTSFSYYKDFIQNNIYFFLKRVPLPMLPAFIYELYRNHIGNIFNVRRGLKHLYYRHIAFCIGFVRAYKAWRRYNFSGSASSSKSALF
jgi:GT2 family glycosyltransferase